MPNFCICELVYKDIQEYTKSIQRIYRNIHRIYKDYVIIYYPIGIQGVESAYDSVLCYSSADWRLLCISVDICKFVVLQPFSE